MKRCAPRLKFYARHLKRRMSSILTALIVSVCIVLVGILGYYSWTGVLPGAKLIEQRPPLDSAELGDTQAKFMFFYAPWCPHCKTANAPWASLKQLVANSGYTYGGKTVSFEDINADSNRGKAALYKIVAYPTFKIETKDKLFEMKGSPSVNNLRGFLKDALGAEKAA